MNKILFLGAGKMAEALIQGLHTSPNMQLSAIETQTARRDFIEKTFNVPCEPTLTETRLSEASVLVLALKPQVLLKVLEDHQHLFQKNKLKKNCLVISIAAGICCEQIAKRLVTPIPIVRCMPNTPAQVGCGISALFANDMVNTPQKELAQSITSSVGKSLWLEDESLIDSVTAISGSGPAYFFYMMQAMVEAGQSIGLSEAQSMQLVLQTALGSVKLAMQKQAQLSELQADVTSKGGTTQAAIEVLEQAGVSNIIKKAVAAAKDRSIELSK